MFVVANNYIYHRGPKDKDFTLYSIPLSGEAKILEIKGYGSYIWLATSRGAVVYNRRKRRMFTFGRNEGLPSDVVYAVEPGADWVWFLTRDGVVRFNWRAYFE
jgi:ligand-binding sensor domain-containing protein